MFTRRVDVDCGDYRTRIQEFVVSQCHADQLAVAVRSPISAQEEQHHAMTAVIREGPRFAGLVEQREVG